MLAGQSELRKPAWQDPEADLPGPRAMLTPLNQQGMYNGQEEGWEIAPCQLQLVPDGC